jgi:hypothetical protein
MVVPSAQNLQKTMKYIRPRIRVRGIAGQKAFRQAGMTRRCSNTQIRIEQT